MLFVRNCVKHIREHTEIGVGSCSTIDECYSDAELEKEIIEASITNNLKTVDAVVQHFLELEKIRTSYENEILAEVF